MDAKAHSKVWLKVGNDVEIAITGTKDIRIKRDLRVLALFATIVGAAYHNQAKEEADVGAKV